MRYTLIAAAALLMVESAALACSCIATDDPAELQRLGAESAREAVALVEVEALTSFEPGRGGEQMKVVRTLAGSAPAQFQIERGPHPGSASCDILYEPGQRDIVILYPADNQSGATPVYRTSGLCSQHLLDKPLFRDAVIDAMEPSGGGGIPGERG